MYSKFSPAFVEACLNSQLRSGDKMPCPRCGHGDVVFRNPRKHLIVAAIIAAVSLIAVILSQTSIAIGTGLAAGITALTIIGMEPSYVCEYCRHTWRFRDAEKWAKAIRHDHEADQ